jgi:hypothetical protein
MNLVGFDPDFFFMSRWVELPPSDTSIYMATLLIPTEIPIGLAQVCVCVCVCVCECKLRTFLFLSESKDSVGQIACVH